MVRQKQINYFVIMVLMTSIIIIMQKCFNTRRKNVYRLTLGNGRRADT